MTLFNPYARAMLMSILSDTRNLTHNVADQDREAFETLLPIAASRTRTLCTRA